MAIGPDGSYYISDHANHAIRRVDRAGNISTYAGGKAGFAGDEKSVAYARFNMPISVSISPDRKYLLVADIRNYRIRRVTLYDGQIETVAGNGKRDPIGWSKGNHGTLDPRAAAYDEAGNLTSWNEVGMHYG